MTEKTYDYVKAQAERLGRSCRWHTGLLVEALAQASQGFTPAEHTQLDELLRHPEKLRELLKESLAHRTAPTAPRTKGQ